MLPVLDSSPQTIIEIATVKLQFDIQCFNNNSIELSIRRPAPHPLYFDRLQSSKVVHLMSDAYPRTKKHQLPTRFVNHLRVWKAPMMKDDTLSIVSVHYAPRFDLFPLFDDSRSVAVTFVEQT